MGRKEERRKEYLFRHSQMEEAESEAVSTSGVKSNLGVRQPRGAMVAVEVFTQQLDAR